MKASTYFEETPYDPEDPNPWLALYLDRSIPIRQEAKAALLIDGSSRSRQFLLPVVRPLAMVAIALFQVVKIFIPKRFTSSQLLHKMICFFLKRWASPQANFMILRHFHIGTEILEFMLSNVPEVEIELNPLRPTTVEDLKNDVFLKHDLNIYNFIIELNQELQEKGIELTKRENLNYDCITDGPFPIEEMPNRWTNIIDLETAIEFYTPVYQLFLTDSDFWRACNSLQLDETVAIYTSKLIGDPTYLGLVNNKHPLVPLSTLRAGYRLMLHGLAAESLHASIVLQKRAQELALDNKNG